MPASRFGRCARIRGTRSARKDEWTPVNRRARDTGAMPGGRERPHRVARQAFSQGDGRGGGQMNREQQKKPKSSSVLSDKEQFGKKEGEEKLSHMGDKPGSSQQRDQPQQQSKK
jgi:hypothetical protein